jgi:hypothetical protein
MLFIRRRMFTPMPDNAPGMGSTRIAEVLNFRAAIPPVATLAHIHAILRSPTFVEREMAELLAAGTVRKIVVRRRSEALIQTSDLEEMVRRSPELDEETKEAFIRWVRDEFAITRTPLLRRQADALVRAGFLTAAHGDDLAASSWARVETAISPDTVSKAASGSLDAVGGPRGRTLFNTGRIPQGHHHTLHEPDHGLVLAVPGNGTFIKLVSAAVSHLVQLVSKTPFREMPETAARERWDGGLRSESQRARGEFVGVLPGQTKKWKEFYGLAFGWVLEEAVGEGVVELFETGSVGRAVRVL